MNFNGLGKLAMKAFGVFLLAVAVVGCVLGAVASAVPGPGMAIGAALVFGLMPLVLTADYESRKGPLCAAVAFAAGAYVSVMAVPTSGVVAAVFLLPAIGGIGGMLLYFLVDSPGSFKRLGAMLVGLSAGAWISSFVTGPVGFLVGVVAAVLAGCVTALALRRI